MNLKENDKLINDALIKLEHLSIIDEQSDEIINNLVSYVQIRHDLLDKYVTIEVEKIKNKESDSTKLEEVLNTTKQFETRLNVVLKDRADLITSLNSGSKEVNAKIMGIYRSIDYITR